MIQRADIPQLIGVDFSEIFDVNEMQTAVLTGISHAALKHPKLSLKLVKFVPKLEALVVLKGLLDEKVALVQQIKTQLNRAEKLLKKVLKVYNVKNQLIVAAIGAQPGAQPPYPTAGAEGAPLVAAIASAQELIVQLEDRLDLELKKMSERAESFKQKTEELGQDILSTLEQYEPKQYEPEKKQFIYN